MSATLIMVKIGGWFDNFINSLWSCEKPRVSDSSMGMLDLKVQIKMGNMKDTVTQTHTIAVVSNKDLRLMNIILLL